MRRIFLSTLLVLMLSLAAVASSGRPHRVHALTNATIYVAPGRVVQHGTLIIRDGKIEAVGENVAIPPDARIWDLHGAIVHAGFIDPYVTVSRLEGKPLRARKTFTWPDDDASPTPTPAPGAKPAAASGPNPRVHPDWRVVDHLTPATKAVEALREDGFVAVQAVPDSGLLRGTSAIYSLADEGAQRQALREDTAEVLAFEPPDDPTDDNSYPESEMGMVALFRQSFSDARWYQDARRANLAAYGGVHRPPLDTGLEALQPVVSGDRPVLFESATLLEDLRISTLEDELHLPHRMTVLSGEEWRHLDWFDALPKADWVLPLKFPEAPKATTPAEWLDVDLLTLRTFRYAPAVPRWLNEDHKTFSLTTHRLEKLSDFPAALQQALDAGLPEEQALAALTTVPARALGVSDRLGTLEPGKAASLVVCKDAVLGRKCRVLAVWVEGTRYPIDSGDEDKKKPAAEKKPLFTAADYAARPALPPLPREATVFVHGATIWTEGPQGILKNADMVVSNGRIQQVGVGLTPPPRALVIDGRGLHVTPGIIDCHSHTAIDGDVNEGTVSCSSMVRIKDVLNPLDPMIYRELAGGTTIANVLHGSANAIGGQVVTCKWRWGGRPQDLIMQGAPEGIKFALGENPKQSNWGDKYRHRYPQTRLGVAEFIRDRFIAAREYRRQWNEYKASPAGKIPPRRDFALDALLEILDGTRYIHCHSYRQDEILMLMRLSDELGFHVRTFQHVLEGYKIADELAHYGAGASTFSDWWAYKYEVIDAIPYNGALMNDRNVLVSFNSDDPDLARRLNTEAAKALRWGNVPPDEALAFVTINPARQLGISDRVGSLEAGKEADFVVWSDSPLSLRALCLQTWIDGRKYFDRADDAKRTAADQAERETLVARLKKEAQPK